jgi:hypothetical protein
MDVLNADSGAIQRLIMCNNAHVRLCGYVSKQNCQYWSKRLCHMFEKPLHTSDAPFSVDF